MLLGLCVAPLKDSTNVFNASAVIFLTSFAVKEVARMHMLLSDTEMRGCNSFKLNMTKCTERCGSETKLGGGKAEHLIATN